MTAKTMHPSEADLRATLADLADRWEQLAASEAAQADQLRGPGAAEAALIARVRAHTYRAAASDVRDVLRTGLPPHGLMTDAELQQHGATEEAGR